MRFLIDECTGPAVAKWLSECGHDVFSVYEQDRGVEDDAILEMANNESGSLSFSNSRGPIPGGSPGREIQWSVNVQVPQCMGNYLMEFCKGKFFKSPLHTTQAGSAATGVNC